MFTGHTGFFILPEAFGGAGREKRSMKENAEARVCRSVALFLHAFPPFCEKILQAVVFLFSGDDRLLAYKSPPADDRCTLTSALNKNKTSGGTEA